MAKRFHHSYEVCKCKHVSLGEVIFSIKEKNARTLQEISDFTDAGSSCKCCQSEEKDIGEEKLELYLDQIIDKFVG